MYQCDLYQAKIIDQVFCALPHKSLISDVELEAQLQHDEKVCIIQSVTLNELYHFMIKE